MPMWLLTEIGTLSVDKSWNDTWHVNRAIILSNLFARVGESESDTKLGQPRKTLGGHRRCYWHRDWFRVTVYANSISCFDNLLRKLYELHYRAGVINYKRYVIFVAGQTAFYCNDRFGWKIYQCTEKSWNEGRVMRQLYYRSDLFTCMNCCAYY